MTLRQAQISERSARLFLDAVDPRMLIVDGEGRYSMYGDPVASEIFAVLQTIVCPD